MTKKTDAKLIRQKHGGALKRGNPGNKGGGRTPNEIKSTLREIIDSCGIPWITAVLNAPRTVACPECGHKIEPPAAEGVRARVFDTVVRSSVGTQQEVEHKGMVLFMGKSLSE
jgi:hypothetical protein